MQTSSNITFSDTNFLVSQWETTPVTFCLANAKDYYFDSEANIMASREPTGGKTKNSPFRQTICVWGHKRPQAGKNSYVAVCHLNKVAKVVPRVIGGIKKLDVSFELMSTEGEVMYALLAQVICRHQIL
jgi:hypothetical protein